MHGFLTSLNRLWDALSPLSASWRQLVHVLEASAPYAGWCLGCAVGLALLGLLGLALFAPNEPTDHEGARA
jgi:hypothetical protein